jgi:hypothetical protein
MLTRTLNSLEGLIQIILSSLLKNESNITSYVR